MPKVNKRTAPAQELDGPQTKIVNGVTMTQTSSHMVIPTNFPGRGDQRSPHHILTLLLFYKLCAYSDNGIFEGKLDDLKYSIELGVEIDLKTLRAIVNDLEKDGSLKIERRRGLPSRYSIPQGLGIPGPDTRWLSTGEGDWKKPWRW